MKTTNSFLLLVALSPVAIMLSSCSKTDPNQPAAPTTPPAAQDLVTEAKTSAADSWDSIKDFAYEKRDDFAIALDRMAEKSDADIRAMNAKLIGLPDATAKVRDSALKELNNALADLKVQTANLRTSSAETWADAKENVSQSWRRVQAACEKLKTSPAS